MPVFKTFFKIINKNKFTLLLYLVIFLGISLSITNLTKNPTESIFTDTRIPVAVIDRDNTAVSKALTEYMATTQNLKELEDDKDKLQDALFFRDVEYILIIPEGFSDSLLTSGSIQLDNINVPNSYSGIYVNLQLEQFLTTMKAYISAGQDAPTAMTSAVAIMSEKTQVNMLMEDGALTTSQKYMYYFQYIPYIMSATIILMIGIIMLSFNKEEVRKRTICSSTTLRSRNLQLALGCGLLSLAIWSVIIVISMFLFKDKLFSGNIFLYLILNSLIFTIVTVSLGFCVGCVAKSESQLSGIATIASMVLSFLGGVFVPLTFMDSKMIVLAKFLPSYWYVKSNTILGYSTSLNSEQVTQIMQNTGIQLIFAVALFAIALVISKKRSSRA